MFAPAWLLLASAAVPQDPSGSSRSRPRDTFEDSLEVREIQVPVQVLVKNQPVRGLTVSDFRLVVDGTEREIVGFEVVDLPTSSAGTGAARETSPAAARHFLALFDLARSPRNRLARAVRSVRTMMREQLLPADRLGIALLSAGGASLVLGLTDDRETAEWALDLIEAQLDRDGVAHRRAVAGLEEKRVENTRELSRMVGPIAALVLGDPPDMTERPIPAADVDFGSLLSTPGARFASGVEEAFELSNVLAQGAVLSAERRMNRSFGDLVTLLRGVPGQKYCLFFSRGLRNFEDRLQGLTGGPTQTDAGIGAGLSEAYREVVEALGRSGWVVQAFDVSAPGSADPGSLFYLADATGGRLYQNYARLEVATERLLERTSVTYVLTFQAVDPKRDGRQHEIKVKLVDGPAKAKLVFRNSYWAPKPAVEMSPLERILADAERLFDEPDSAEIDVSLLTLLSPAPGGRSRVTIALGAKRRALFGPAGFRTTGSFQIQAFAAETGRRDPLVHDLFNETVVLKPERDGEAIRAGGLQFLGDLLVPPGEHLVRVRLRHLDRDRQFLASRPLAVPPAWKPTLLPALFLDPAAHHMVRLERGSGLVEDPSSPLAVSGGPIVPLLRPTVRRPGEVPILAKVYGPWSGSSELQGRVVAENGREVRAARFEVRQIRSAPPAAEIPTTSLLAVVVHGEEGEGSAAAAGLMAGVYHLELTWLEAGEAVATSSARFTVE